MPAHQRPTPNPLDQLVVYPPAHPHPSWVAYRSSSQAAAPVCLLSNDPRHWPRTPHTVLVVPAQRLSWHRTTLPPIAARQWQQALRGLLEEQLLEDPARLHLALAPDTRPATPTWVAACEKAWLEGVLKTLLEAGCRPERIVPELEPTLASDAACYLYGKPGQILLAQTGSEGVWAVCVPEPALLFLQQWPTGSDVTAVWAEPELLDLARSLRAGAVQSLTQGERLHGQGRLPMTLELLGAQDLMARIHQVYETGSSSAAAVVHQVQSDTDLSALMQLPAAEDLLASRDDAPIVRMLNAMLTQAVREGASDIHIEPYAEHSSVRMRIDGTLRKVVEPHRGLHDALISRLKIMAELDIAEKRLPQDGRLSLRVGTRTLDVRVSTLPCAHGERAVLRLLEKSGARLKLADVGMQGQTLKKFEAMVHRPHGLVLVTGPTGSGKTTTLYAALGELDVGHNNIMTVEDPIEYELPGIGQTQVNPRIDLGFARALRAILRQDPDVILIGEIRDSETAQIAIAASLTGHLVLATLHTNDAVSAITRLTDMGVEAYLIGACLTGVLAQRLVRKLCATCQGAGCPACSHSGFKGRTGVFELLEINTPIRRLIHDEAGEIEIRKAALQTGLVLMRDDGQRLVREGTTTLDELLRVTT